MRIRSVVATCLGVLLFLAGASPVGAAPDQVLRFGSVAPEGGAWARTFRIFTNHVERATGGTLAIKLYLGGVAGDERGMQERVAKGQLDGVLSAGILCIDVMPTLRVTRIPGVFQTRDEATHVVSELGATLEQEARQAGFVLLGTAGVGSSVIFSRRPIRSMSDLRATRFWRWQHDDVAVRANRAMGLSIEPMSFDSGAKAYDEGRIDGFLAAPTAALTYQWHTQVEYMVDLWGDYLVGCFAVTAEAFDRLTPAQQRALREAGVKLSLGFEEANRSKDEALLGGVFARHGVESLPASAQLRAEYFQAARQQRRKAGAALVPDALLSRVLRMLADYRAEHGGGP